MNSRLKSDKSVSVAFVGDITPGGVMAYSGGISAEVRNFLDKFDFRIGTLESCFGEGESFCQIKMNDSRMGNCIYSPDKCIDILLDLKIDAVSLANNHACDCGLEGLYRTIDLLDKHHIRHFGAGRNIREASQPLILSKNGKTICLLGYNTIARAPYKATPEIGGMNWFEIDNVIKDISVYKNRYDHVVVMPHWGIEHTIWPTFYPDVQSAYKMIAAGAAAVIGSHTHLVQPVVKYKKGIIAMSLGNFVFPDRYITKPRNTCYPTRQEIEQHPIPHTYGYPFVETLTYKYAPDEGRMGVICSVQFGDKVSFNRTYSYLTPDHNLVLRKANLLKRIKLFLVGLCVKDDSFFLYRTYCYSRRILSRLKQ